MIPQEAIEAAKRSVQTLWESSDVLTPETEARTALEAAAPFIRAQALEDAADELARLHGIGMRRSDLCTPEEKADYRAYAEHDGDYSEWLRVRAATERGPQ